RQPDMTRTTTLRVAAWGTTGVFAAMMTVSGILYLVGPKALMDGLRELGYPLYFLKLLGATKLLGAAALIAPVPPRVREWAYAGFAFDLGFAIASHVATGAGTAAPPAVALALVAASYILRERAA